MEFYGTGRLVQIKMTGEENIHVGSSHPKVFFEVNVLKFKIYFFCSGSGWLLLYIWKVSLSLKWNENQNEVQPSHFLEGIFLSARLCLFSFFYSSLVDKYSCFLSVSMICGILFSVRYISTTMEWIKLIR